MFQHPGMVLYVMYLALFYAHVCLFKESTPSLVLVNLRIFDCVCILRITESVISCKGVRWDLKSRSS